jgi:DNA-binding protein YbaB
VATAVAVSDVVTEYLNLGGAVTAQFDHYLHRLSRLSATATDETKTVAVTVNSNGGIEDVWLQPGIKQLDADAISEHLNEALQKAAAAIATTREAIDADYSRALAPLQARSDDLNALIDTDQLTSFAPDTNAPDTGLPTNAPAVAVSDPARSIFVTTRNGHAIKVTITPAALNRTKAELAASIVEVARFSYARDRAVRAEFFVAQAVALGDKENECRRCLHQMSNL